MAVPEVFEWLTLTDGQEFTFSPVRWELSDTSISLRGARQGTQKPIKVLTIYVPKSEKEFGPQFWDIGQQTLIAQLYPLLSALKVGKDRIRIKARGSGPGQRYSVSVV